MQLLILALLMLTVKDMFFIMVNKSVDFITVNVRSVDVSPHLLLMEGGAPDRRPMVPPHSCCCDVTSVLLHLFVRARGARTPARGARRIPRVSDTFLPAGGAYSHIFIEAAVLIIAVE